MRRVFLRKNKPGEGRISIWWPKIENVATAKVVIERGAGVAILQTIFVGILTTLVVAGAINSVMGIGGFDYFDVVGYGAAAYFLYYKQSRVAAVFALGNYCAGMAFSAAAGRNPVGILGLLFILAYLNAVRATFMLRRLQRVEMAEATVYGN